MRFCFLFLFFFCLFVFFTITKKVASKQGFRKPFNMSVFKKTWAEWKTELGINLALSEIILREVFTTFWQFFVFVTKSKVVN